MTLVSTWLNGTTDRSRPRLVLIATSLVCFSRRLTPPSSISRVKSIATDLHAGVSEMQWVIDAYNLVYASLLLTGGTLGDLYGRRRISFSASRCSPSGLWSALWRPTQRP